MCGEKLWPDDMSLFEKIVTGASAAATVGTTAAAFMQDTPKVSSAPAVATDEDTAADAKAARQRALARQSKTKATNLTGGLGLTGQANTGLKMLFGGR